VVWCHGTFRSDEDRNVDSHFVNKGVRIGTASLVNSYLGVIRVSMEYSKMNGSKPDLSFLGISTMKREALLAQT
jgi:hypothetical protein